MNTCLNCGEETNNNKFCSVSCQMEFQNVDRSNKRYGEFKDFKVKCEKCGKEIIICEREKLFPQKEKYYCNRSCANSRNHSEETKYKIRRGMNEFCLTDGEALRNKIEKEKIAKNTSKNIVKGICKNCGKEFSVPYRKRRQSFCSRSCASVFREKESTKNRITTKKKFRIKKPKDLNKKTFIYSLEYPAGNVRYVGKSDTPQTRLKNHIKEAHYRKKNHRDKWINSLPEPPILNIIEETTYEHWQEREIYWIKFYRESGANLVNGTDGGEGSNSFLGRKHTEETKEKLRKISTGKKASQETLEKMSGENSSRCKVKDNDIREMLNMYYIDKINIKTIANKYDLNKKYLYQILKGFERRNMYKEFKLTHFI